MTIRSDHIPLWVQLAYTAFVAVLVPYYWQAYGPTNFLYYCDVALLMGLAAAWTGRSLLASAPAVGILVPQALWIVDFLGTAVGVPLVGMTAYMFDPALPLFTRGLSFFHFWLPLALLGLLARLGYDRPAIDQVMDDPANPPHTSTVAVCSLPSGSSISVAASYSSMNRRSTARLSK